MRIVLHIGLPQTGAERLQAVLADKRGNLAEGGTLFAESPGRQNHTRLFMAVTEPGHVDPLRFNRGYATPEAQAMLRTEVAEALAAEIEAKRPETLILSAAQLGASLVQRSELERLRALLTPFGTDIRIIAHVDAQHKLVARHYAAQVFDGRARALSLELGLLGQKSWWQACLGAAPKIAPRKGLFIETQTPPFWLDYTALVAHWESVFGVGTMHLHAYEPERFAGPEVIEAVRESFGITQNIGTCKAGRVPAQPSAASLARGRRFNALILQMLEAQGRTLPRQLWAEMIAEMSVPGDPIDPRALAPVAHRFAADNAQLARAHDLPAGMFDPPASGAAHWQEADPTKGFRASQYLLHYKWRIDRAARQSARRAARKAQAGKAQAGKPELSDAAKAIMPPLAQQNFEKLLSSRFAPHNQIGQHPEAQSGPAYPEVPLPAPPDGTTGNIIVGCMKNEAPYILEWVAYHRAIGVHNFLIYTNGCEDGTDEILDRLQALGLLQHRLNDDWKGKSPQQYALNKSLKEPLIRDADWIIHIDVDEFINVRCGNGTLQDFLAEVPQATNIAMTWRLFGHNDVNALSDDFVTAQFDTCAPKFCPKPHTVWGFKTMFRNTGAYAKISCHRPNKLDPAWRGRVHWVNGNGADITGEMAERGWRSSMKSIGYDKLQLNHYALRSAESFLIKRQRGRALHVDRSIGLNYWIRMDWSVHKDVTIQRNLPRLKAEYDRLLGDPVLAKWHEKGRAWHRAKADELKKNPEFKDLYEQVQRVKLTETERVAYALALDMES